MKKTSIQAIYTVILKEIRRERRFNQRRLANALQVSPGTVAKFETGALPLTLENFQKISYFFGYSVTSVHDVAEKYAMWLSHFFDYDISLQRLDKDDDDLLILANEFYASEISKLISDNYLGTMSYFGGVMKFPRLISHYSLHKVSNDFIDLRNVFRYITNESFRTGEIVDGYGRWGDKKVIFEEYKNYQEVMDYFKYDPNIQDVEQHNKQNYIVNYKKFIDKLHKNSFPPQGHFINRISTDYDFNE